jgi:hypothetical protein
MEATAIKVRAIILAMVLAMLVALTAASPAEAYAALCYDGTLSGTCSYHGGVYQWFAQ